MDKRLNQRVAALLVAKAAIAAGPLAEMKALAARLAAFPGIDTAAFAFTERHAIAA